VAQPLGRDVLDVIGEAGFGKAGHRRGNGELAGGRRRRTRRAALRAETRDEREWKEVGIVGSRGFYTRLLREAVVSLVSKWLVSCRVGPACFHYFQDLKSSYFS